MVKCQECGKEFDKDRGLHLHIKAHKLSISDYYHKYFPRKDRHTGDLIKFKNKEQYFSSDFNSKTNLKSWLKKVSIDKAQAYCRDILQKRKD